MFHANQHGYLCNQNFHGKPCHNHQKHGRPWNWIFNQARLLRSSGAKTRNCESVCPLDLLPSMCICVHILAVEVKTYIFNAFKDNSDPFHTEPLPQQPRQGLLPPQQPTEPPQSLCLVRACSHPQQHTEHFVISNVIYQNGEKMKIRNPFFAQLQFVSNRNTVFENCKISKHARNTQPKNSPNRACDEGFWRCCF